MDLPSGTAAAATLAASIALTIALAACSGGADDAAPPPDSGVVGVPGPSAPASAPASVPAPAAHAGAAALLRAAETAGARVEGGKVFEVGREPTGRWGVTLVTADGTEHDLEVSEDGTAVEAGPDADRDDDAEDLRELDRLFRAPVGHVAALEAAAASGAAGELSEVGLDDDHGTAVWEVTYGEGAEAVAVVVDATTAEVLETGPAD